MAKHGEQVNLWVSARFPLETPHRYELNRAFTRLSIRTHVKTGTGTFRLRFLSVFHTQTRASPGFVRRSKSKKLARDFRKGMGAALWPATLAFRP